MMAFDRKASRLPGWFLAGIIFVLFTLASAAAPRFTLSPHHVPKVASGLQSIGRVPGSNQLTLTIGLPLRNEQVLSNLLAELYDPTSTNFHHYLSPQQFADQFGAAPEDYQALIGFAQSNHLAVKQTHGNRLLVTITGAVSDIERTFHTALNVYNHPTENRTFFAPDVEPTLDLAVPVLDISGLDNYLVPKPMSLHIKPAGVIASAAATGSGPSGTFIGNDFRAAYIPGVSLTGTGQTVGLIEFDSYYKKDITNYENLAGLPNVTLTNISPDGNIKAGKNNDEVALDIEVAISMAPGLSKVAIYQGTVANDIISAAANNPIANQVSASWSYSINSTTENLFKQFASQGQSFFNASGDSGAYTSSSNPVPTPSDEPNIIIVGGTTLTTTGPGGAYVSETVWNWFTTGEGNAASSGGISANYSIPVWQQGLSAGTNGASATMRNLPDVALTGDNVFVDYNNGSSGTFGGTSCAAPLWAAFTALINQQAQQFGQTNAGFINPAVYAIAKGTNYNADFHDITTGNNTNQFTLTQFFATTNYDLCTGLGSPNGTAMISALTQGSILVVAQPTNLVVGAGTNATFSIGAVGAGVNFQWKFNGTNIAHATNSSYTIVNAQTANQGTYSAVVSNSIGSILTSNATLVVNTPPLITTQPLSQTVAQGSNAAFTVAASGSPAPTYQWQFNGTNISAATNTIYTVTNSQLANQGTYSALVSNSSGTLASSNAVLTVNAAPSITTQPTSHTVNQGSSVGFVCNASGSSPLSLQWYFNGSPIPGATNTLYAISGAQFSQQGNYWMIVTNSLGSATSSVAVLTVDAPPAITSQPQSASQTVSGSASFSVAATGSAPLNYQWYLNSAALANSSRISGAQSAILSISNLTAADAGNYQVSVGNAYGSSNSAIAALSISKATPVLTWTNPASVVYGTALGSNQLDATASQPGAFAYNPPSGTVLNSGFNTLSVSYTPTDSADYNNVTNSVFIEVIPAPLTVIASNATRLYGQANPAFVVSVIGATNNDVFTTSATCIATATNLPGNYPIMPVLNDPNSRLTNYTLTQSNGTLTILPAAPPAIASIVPNNGSTNGGDTVNIFGTNFESGAIVYFGALAATNINVTNATNIIVTTPAQSYGMVDVIITNADGQSIVFTNGFTYAQPALLVSGPTNESVMVGGSVTFTANSSGTAPLQYQWLFNTNVLAGATNSTFSITNAQPTNAGLYQIVVSNAYGASTSAVVTLSVLNAPVSFTAPSRARFANGQFILQISGMTGQGPIVIQSSSNLVNWISIYTNPPGFGQFQFIDTNAASNPTRYYRALTPVQ